MWGSAIIVLECRTAHFRAWCFALLVIVHGTTNSTANPPQKSSILPTELTCEYLRNPLAVNALNPRLSWELSPTRANQYGTLQTAYQIQVASSRDALLTQEGELLWDSGLVASNRTLHIAYSGTQLSSGRQCFWRVRTWDQESIASEWSSIASWRVGLLHDDDWQGTWIGASDDNDTSTANQFYRKTFELDQPISDGIIYVASLGYHELFINGRRVTDTVLAPAISDPMHRVRYVAYDVTEYLRVGSNVLCVSLGAGWTLYDGLGWPPETQALWPRRPMLRVQGLFVGEKADELLEIHSDESWRVHPANIQPIRRWVFSDFNGERQIGDWKFPDWKTIDFDESQWDTAQIRTSPRIDHLTAQNVEPNRVIETIPVQKIERVEPNTFHVTLEKMFTGFLDVSLTGRPHATVTVEVSDRETDPCVYNQRQEFTLNEQGRGHFRNRFNYVMGRWLTIRGDIDPPTASRIQGLLIGTDIVRSGRFKCSKKLHNQIYDMALHTFQCLNLGGYVVDCSHRERLGYGDGQVAVMLMLPNYKCGAFLTKWLEDWHDVQQPDGNLPFTAPTYAGGGGPAWSGFALHTAWDVYERFDDLHVLEEMYPTIKNWLAFLETHVSNNQLKRYGGPAAFISERWSFLGDWVPPGRDQTPNGDAPETHFFNNCYYAWSLQRASAIAQLLGHLDDASRYKQAASSIAAATHQKYWDSEQRTYSDGRQANLAIALISGVVPKTLRAEVEKRLVEQIEDKCNGHLDTGIIGTFFLLRALQSIDRSDLGYRIANQRDYPGWGHFLAEGATAFWEQWDGGNSRCHSSFLDIGGWYIESIAGIQHDPEEPAYKHILIKPGIDNDLTWAQGEISSPRGTIRTSWKRNDDRLELDVGVPPNTTATVYLPSANGNKTLVNQSEVRLAPGVLNVVTKESCQLIDVTSGHFHFECKIK